MKTCPVCQAKAFDDAAICYGCLYRYGEGDDASTTSSAQAEPDGPVEKGDTLEREGAALKGGAVDGGEGAAADSSPAIAIEPVREPIDAYPSFLIRFTPTVREAGLVAWSCEVETIC